MLFDPAGMKTREIYALMIDLIIPRPIALVSTVAASGARNLAPFSYYIGLSPRPPLVGISVARRHGMQKDTAANIRETEQFVICATTEAILSQVVITSGDYASEVDEFALSGLSPVASDLVAPPRVAESPVAMECRLDRMVDLHGSADLIIGEVLRFHVDDALLHNHRIDPRRLQPVGRLGSNLYSKLGELLVRDRPQ